MLDAIPLGRTGHPKDIAETVTFVSSDRSTWTTGAVFEVTGGSQAGRTHMPVACPADQTPTHTTPHHQKDSINCAVTGAGIAGSPAPTKWLAGATW